MKSIKPSVLLATMLLLLGFGMSVKAQVNLALTATATHSGGGAPPSYGPNIYNDNIIPPFPTSTAGSFGWVYANGWIEYTWANPVNIDSITFHNGSSTNRCFNSLTVQYWDGTGYVSAGTVTGGPVASVSYQLPTPAFTTKLRFFTVTGSNPAFSEIQVWEKNSGSNDAGVSALASPTLPFCAGTHNVSVRVKNFGINLINNVTLNWTWNGTAQTHIPITTPLDTVGGTGVNTVDILLQNTNLSSSNTLKAWTSNPNNVADTINVNDTLELELSPAINGTVTINSAAPTAGTNFQSFNDFATALNTYGVCGPVVANVVPGSGPYNETVTFYSIGGASATNTIRINGNGETIQTTPTGTTDNKLITLNGAEYVTIDSLNIKSNHATYGWGVWITGAASHDSILRCTIDLSSITGTSSTNANGIVASGSATSATTAGQASHIYIGYNKVIAGSTGSGGGYYGISFYGMGSTSQNDSIYIVGNEVTNFYYYGINYRYVNGGEVSDNNVHRSTQTAITTTCYSIYVYYCLGVKVNGNRIHDLAGPGVTSTASFYGLRCYNYNNTAATPITISNNLIYNLGNYGGIQYISYVYGPYQNFYHNTIDASAIQSGNSSTMYGLYLGIFTGSNVKNNIINITGGNNGTKYGIYVSSTTYPIDLQKNNVNVNSSQSGTMNPYYRGGAFASLAAFQTANPTFEIGSPSVDPSFASVLTGDYTPTASALINQGTNVYADVPVDINGLPRSTSPTIGAFEFLPTGGNDGKSVLFLSPASSFCANTTLPVEVVIGNGGSNTINSMQVNWTVNGVAQTPYSYTGTLTSPVNPSGQSLDTIVLGSIVLPSGSNTIKVWTSLPNNAVDPNNINDTILWTSYSSLSGGTYTINSAAATGGTNFQSFGDFASALSYGICGPVVANVVAGSGPYTELVSIGNIPNTSAINTVRINGNGELLQYNSTSLGSHVMFGLNGTTYFTLNNLKIKALGSTYGWGVHITGSAQYDSILNCDIDLSNITGTNSVNTCGITISGSTTSPSSTSSVSHVMIKNNKVLAGETGAGGAYYGISVYGAGSTAQNDSISIVNNEVSNFNTYGINFYYCLNGEVSGNNVHRSTKTVANSTCYGINVYYNKGTKIIGNKVHDFAAPGISSTSTLYGMRIYNYNNTSATPILVANNIIYNLGNYSGTQYLMYVYGAAHQVYHNTVDASLIQSNSGSTMYGMYVGYNNGDEIQNNIINITGGNTGTKHGIYMSSTSYTANLQKNNVHVASAQSGAQNQYYWGGAYTTLAAFQAAFPTQEVGSPSVAPQFISATTGDLSPLNTLLMTAGTNLSATVPTDILGQTRSTTPTVGAFEFSVLGNNNARALSFVNPTGNYCATTVPVEVMIGNVGLNNITSLQVNWSVNGVLQTPVAYTNTLVPIGSASGQSFDTVALGTTLLNTGSNIIKAWTSLPNGLPDPYPANDTTIINAEPTSFNLSPTLPTICANDVSVVSLSPSTGYPAGSLEWEQSTDGGLTWTVIPNSDTVNYVVTNIGQNMTYRVHILSGGGTCYSPNATVNVNYVAPPTVMGAESCYPDSLTISATASTGNVLKWYESLTATAVYTTNNTITTPPLSATKIYYAVSENSAGCQSVRTPVAAVIHVLPPVDLGGDASFCVDNNAAVTLDPGPQHSGATFTWSDNSTNATLDITQSGTYYVTVTDTNSCFKSDTANINLNPNPVVDLSANGTNFCEGADKILDAGPDGQNGGSYYWSTGDVTQTINVTASGTYFVSVTSAFGCETSDTIDVIQAGFAPTVDGIHATAQGNANFNFAAINPQNVTDYYWDFGDGTNSIASSPNHAYASNGVFLVRLIVNSTCADANDSAYVNIIGLGVNNSNLDAKLISVYPNPNHSSQITLEASGDLMIKSVTLVNLLGQEQGTWNSSNNGQSKWQISLPEQLSSGMFQLIINTNKGKMYKKIELIK